MDAGILSIGVSNHKSVETQKVDGMINMCGSTASQVTSTGGRQLSTVWTDAWRKSNIAGID